VRVLLVLAVIAAAGCSLGADERPFSNPEPFLFPAWLNATYTDGRITLRYPADWTRGRSDRFGEYVDDATKRTAAFVAVQYLPTRKYESHAEFAELAARILRPPSGRGTTLEYTQAARIGDRAGIEASIIWADDDDSPIGPTMRVYGIELDSGEVAILIFAAENQTNHAAAFGWIKRSITWEAPSYN
jgi:hypothetical protein